MKKVLVTIKDKTRLREMEQFGHIVYVSDYTNLIAMECSNKALIQLEQHPLVESLEDACTGSLQ